MLYDIAIIGSGPGGYVAAEEACHLGFNVILFEEHKIGGVCLNYGCIPTKALLYSSELYYNMKYKASEHGIYTSGLTFDLSCMVDRAQHVVQTLSCGLHAMLHKVNKVFSKVISIISQGDKYTIKCIDQLEYQAVHIIIATGAKHRNIGIDGWSYREAISPTNLPKKLAIIGSGPIGMEFGCFYSSLGTDVTVFEREDRILLFEDKEISNEAERIFTKRGMKFVKSINVNQEQLKDFDCTLVAAGVVPNVLHIDGLKLNKYNGIDIDENCRTNIHNVYAIGDVTTPPCLAHKASRQGVIAVHTIAKLPVYTKLRIPACTYTYPQIASLIDYDNMENVVRSVKYYLSANGLSVAKSKTDGFIKFMLNNSDEIIACHMIGDGVTEIIQSVVLAQSLESTVHEISETIHAHPTLSESVLEVARKSLHLSRKFSKLTS